VAASRGWRQGPRAEGPFAVRRDDIAALNEVFSDAFTERYRRDGMVGVRVPYLNPAVWRYAIEDADGGAMIWRGAGGDIVAFNIAHRSGAEGWMGPLAVRPDAQSQGLGKAVVRAGVDWLRERGARVIGLETMPRTMDNIGFYSALGFNPGRLTITVTIDAAPAAEAPVLVGRLTSHERAAAVAACRDLADAQIAGYDFTREIEITDDLSLGDTVLLRERGEVAAFALCHTVPLVEGRTRDELRVLKMVLTRDDQLGPMAAALADYARRSGSRRVAFRVQGEYGGVYRRLIAMGGRVRWTDLRMIVEGTEEPRARTGVVLSNWEI
jgi:GNAT superfamily N-acetyltransferase